MSSSIQADWDTRHFIANIQYNISKVVTFLNDFGQTHHPSPSPPLAVLLLSSSTRSSPLYSAVCVCPCVWRVADATTRLRLARLNEKLTRLERQVDYLEAAVQNLAEASNEAKLTQPQPP